MPNPPKTDLTPNRPAKWEHGFTNIEALVVLAVLCLLSVILIASSPPDRNRKSPLTACSVNLRLVALGQIIWANDHDSRGLVERYPLDAAGVRKALTPAGLAAHYQSMSNEIVSPKVLVCPSDNRSPAPGFASLTTNHLSYFLNLDGRLEAETTTVIQGDRQIAITPAAREQIVTLTTNLAIRWARKTGHSGKDVGIGNVAFSDGSVMKVTDREITGLLLPPSRESIHRLLFP